MATEFPLALFPKQLFPDVELKEIGFCGASMVISVTESEWAISDEIAYFYGPGDMIFHFSGEPSINLKCVKKMECKTDVQDCLAELESLEVIRRQDDSSWLFQFSNRARGFIVDITLDKVSKIEWTGEADEENMELEAELLN